MMRGIFALIFLGILAAVVNYFPIPAPFNWLILIVLLVAALYVIAAIFGLISPPGWLGRPMD